MLGGPHFVAGHRIHSGQIVVYSGIRKTALRRIGRSPVDDGDNEKCDEEAARITRNQKEIGEEAMTVFFLLLVTAFGRLRQIYLLDNESSSLHAFDCFFKKAIFKIERKRRLGRSSLGARVLWPSREETGFPRPSVLTGSSNNDEQ